MRPAASPAEVRAAFRRFAAVHHPDHGGTPARFQAGLEAYHRLTGPPRSPGNVVFHHRRRTRWLERWPRRRRSQRILL
ncbi:MAG TPA: hypothetical protein VHM89_16430 [Acidimicrobiales bacterium]|nr:hypothetical protein [Acidimicrobiales bacterium]